ncbi:MAG: hypothetical protein ACOX83_00370 [Candidatus Spyradocola sp.]|jgi:hypothetical protein
MGKKARWFALAVGTTALGVLLVYGVRLAGPRSGIVDGHLVRVDSFSPLLFGLLLGLALHLTGALRRDIAPLEWLPTLLLCIPLWMHSESPAWFRPYPETSVRLSTLLLALVGIGCVDAALGIWQRRGWCFRWKAALALALLAFLVAASEWPGDAANAVRSATMNRSAAARYIGIYAPPVLRLAAGVPFFFLARRSRPAGAALLAVGGFCLAVDLAAVVLNRLSIDFWDAPALFSWILYDENTLALFSGVFFLGLGAVRVKRA